MKRDDPVFREKLIAMWQRGDSVARIGALLHVTKNVIVGCRNRWGLPQRPSPIIRQAGATGLGRHRQKSATRQAQAKHAALRQAAVEARPEPRQVAEPWQVTDPEPALPPVLFTGPGAAAAAPVASEPDPGALYGPTPPRIFDHCAFPIGEPGRKGFRLCGAPVFRTRCSYCASHAKRAFLRPHKQQLDTEVASRRARQPAAFDHHRQSGLFAPY